MTTFVIIVLLLIWIGKLFDWSARSRLGAFVFWTLLGTGAFWGFFWLCGYGMLVGTADILFDYHDMPIAHGGVQVGSSVVVGMIFAAIRVNSQELKNHFRFLELCDKAEQRANQKHQAKAETEIQEAHLEIKKLRAQDQPTLDDQIELLDREIAILQSLSRFDDPRVNTLLKLAEDRAYQLSNVALEGELEETLPEEMEPVKLKPLPDLILPKAPVEQVSPAAGRHCTALLLYGAGVFIGSLPASSSAPDGWTWGVVLGSLFIIPGVIVHLWPEPKTKPTLN
jgi:hypothetical protein